MQPSPRERFQFKCNAQGGVSTSSKFFKDYLLREISRVVQLQLQYNVLYLQIRHSKSCPNIEMQKKCNNENVCDQAKSVEASMRYEDASVQTNDLFPYEHLLLGMLDQNNQNISQESSDSRLSPISMLDRYIEACTRVNSFPSNNSKTSKYLCNM